MTTHLVIPDIHGQITQLRKALAHIKKHHLQKRGNWHVVFLGDYIDRGESGEYQGKHYKDAGSLLTLQELLEFEQYCGAKGIPLTFLLGNHEEMYRFDQDQIAQDMPSIPEDENTAYCFQKNGMVKELLAFINRCTLYHLDAETGFLFVHAGVDPTRDNPLKSSKENMLWIRESFFKHKGTYPYTIVFGHTPFGKILNQQDRIGLDGGAYMKFEEYGKLNVALLSAERREFLHV